ncbi:MAG: PQQ-binding-like beta-propeller repeat protein, partial [Acidimicrobiales bacterium]
MSGRRALRHAPRRHGARWVLGAVALGAVVLPGCGGSSSSTSGTPSASAAIPTPVSSWDWPSYGHDAQHTFHGRTTLTESSVRNLRQAWFFPTGDAVTATPTVVDGTVYAG